MKRIILFFAVVIVSAGIVHFFLPNDEKEIRGNLVSLAEYGSSPANEAMLDSLKKAALAVKLCKTPFSVTYKARGIEREFNEKELTDRILMVKKRGGGTRFVFEDIRIEINGKKSAAIIATLRLEGHLEDGAFTDAYETNLTAIKIEGDWFFSSFEMVEFLEK